MNTAVPQISSAHAAVPLVFADIGDLAHALCAYSIEADDMIAILVDGDWTSDCAGPIEISELFKELIGPEPIDKTLCAIVVTGNLNAPDAVLIDRDSDWAPSLIVGGNLVAQSMCLGGGQTKVRGNLSLQNALYGHYNHGSLEVFGTTTAEVILSDAFSMEFRDKVRCKKVLSACGAMNIDAHYADDDLERILHADLLDDNNSPIDDLVLQALAGNQSLLLDASKIGKKPKATVSKAGRERLASLEAAAQKDVVRKLNFQHCDLKFVPEAIAQFADATWLGLQGNRIGTLPQFLSKLQQIEVLDISDCGLTKLPKWLGSLPKLRVLDVSRNDIVGLPDFKDAFAALEELKIGNAFSDSNEHKQWACTLPLARFPRLRSFSNHLSGRGTFTASSDFRAWYSTTLEHFHFTPEIAGAMPACIGWMPQLKSLHLQIEEGIEESALAVFSEREKLEAIQFCFGSVSPQFIVDLAAALPETLIRIDAFSTKKHGEYGMPLDMTNAGATPDVDGLIYQERLDEALECVNRQIAHAESLLPCIAAEYYERPQRQKLEILNRIARKTVDWPEKCTRIEAAAKWAATLLDRYKRLSISTVWNLGFELGNQRIACAITQAWWMIRRDDPDFSGATDVLDRAEVELLAYGVHGHLTGPLRNEIESLRKLMKV